MQLFGTDSRTRFSLCICAVLIAVCMYEADAGVLYARRPGTESPVYNLAITHIRTSVTITGLLAVTHVDEEFYNDNTLTLEGFYAFQLPEGARVNGLWLWENGQRKIFVCLKREEAARKYDSVVTGTRRDPALLEALGANRFQLKVFPIAPRSSRRVEIEYFYPMPFTMDGVVHYFYPLKVQGYQSSPIATTEMRITVKSQQRITSLQTSFDDNPLLCRVARPDDYSATITFGLENQTYAKDFTLSYEPENLFSVFPALSWRDTSEAHADPYFMTWHTVLIDSAKDVGLRDLVFVLDASGSMDGQRLTAVRDAVTKILGRLTPLDRFRIVLFSSEALSLPADRSMLDATPENVAKGVDFITQYYEALGMTSYENALRSALATDFREHASPRLLFLTDGDPNMGETSYAGLMNLITTIDTRGVPIYPVLLYTPKVTLLYDIAKARGGKVTIVEAGDDLEVIIARIMIDLKVGGFNSPSVAYLNGLTLRVLPDAFPALTPADRIITTGRWSGDGHERATLEYDIDTMRRSVTRDVDFSASLVPIPHVGKYWAAMMIDKLCEQLKLPGADSTELKNSVIQLSIKHNVLSPFTAFLVLETNPIDPPTSGVEDGGAVLHAFALGALYPNPVTAGPGAVVTIPFDADERAAVRIVIVDALGRVVRVLTDARYASGHHLLTWDGRNDSGARVAAGIYFVRMTAGTFTAMRQVVIR